MDHFYWGPKISDVSTWPDINGSSDLSANGAPSLSTINNKQSVNYSGWDDYHESESAFSFSGNDEYTFVAVVEVDDSADRNPIITNGNSSSDGLLVRARDGVWDVIHSNVEVYNGPSVTTDPTVIVGTYDGLNVIVDFNGSEGINATAQSPNSPSRAFTVAARPAQSKSLNGDVVAAGWEASAADSTRRDELTDKLADPLGISV